MLLSYSSIVLSIQIAAVSQKKKKKSPAITFVRRTARGELHRVSVSAFSRVPEGSLHLYSRREPRRNLSLFIYPFSLVPKGDDLPSFSCGTLSASGSGPETFWESANDWDCLVFYTVKGQPRPRCTWDSGEQRIGRYFLPEGTDQPDNYDDRYHLLPAIIKMLYFYFSSFILRRFIKFFFLSFSL